MHLDGFGGPDVDCLVFRAAPTVADAGRPIRSMRHGVIAAGQAESTDLAGEGAAWARCPPLAIIGSFHAKEVGP